MFRFNNPDALLVCLLVASAYCLVRALEGGSTRWMVGVGTLIGFAFLAKMMQAFLVVPGFALVYLIAAPTTVRRRIGQLLAGGAAMVASAGWWVAIVALWPASSRPMIDGSSDNSILNLIVGYNGLGRLTGSGGGPGGGGGGGNFSGEPGVLRLFNDLMGGQASWLLPAALLVRRRRAGVAAACPAHGPDACRDLALGKLARRQRPRVQPQRRGHPHLLHGCARAGDRRARGDRRRGRVACGASGSPHGRCSRSA